MVPPESWQRDERRNGHPRRSCQRFLPARTFPNRRKISLPGCPLSDSLNRCRVPRSHSDDRFAALRTSVVRRPSPAVSRRAGTLLVSLTARSLCGVRCGFARRPADGLRAAALHLVVAADSAGDSDAGGSRPAPSADVRRCRPGGRWLGRNQGSLSDVVDAPDLSRRIPASRAARRRTEGRLGRAAAGPAVRLAEEVLESPLGACGRRAELGLPAAARSISKARAGQRYRTTQGPPGRFEESHGAAAGGSPQAGRGTGRLQSDRRSPQRPAVRLQQDQAERKEGEPAGADGRAEEAGRDVARPQREQAEGVPQEQRLPFRSAVRHGQRRRDAQDDGGPEERVRRESQTRTECDEGFPAEACENRRSCRAAEDRAGAQAADGQARTDGPRQAGLPGDERRPQAGEGTARSVQNAGSDARSPAGGDGVHGPRRQRVRRASRCR